MSEGPQLTGRCNCGAVSYTLSAPPLAVAACHCKQCRRQSGAAYSVNLIVRASTMQVQGDVASWEDADTESGVPLSRDHCGTCGSPIRSVPGSSPKMIAVKAGTLDDPSRFAPAMHIWVESKLPWVTIPDGLPLYPRGPQV
ncbi:GFA family protein [Sphingomonas sp.]|uniref:GFA family protein n=1 Tax=Sphingomonas sp. TaxID=28214 RepID=UPI003CC59621